MYFREPNKSKPGFHTIYDFIVVLATLLRHITKPLVNYLYPNVLFLFTERFLHLKTNVIGQSLMDKIILLTNVYVVQLCLFYFYNINIYCCALLYMKRTLHVLVVVLLQCYVAPTVDRTLQLRILNTDYERNVNLIY